MTTTSLRDLFKEFPEMPEDILLAASEDSSMLNAIRQRDHFVVVFEVDHEMSAHPMVAGVSMESLGDYLAERDASALVFNGKTVKYQVVSTCKILEGVL
jgi:hypothetical protein